VVVNDATMAKEVTYEEIARDLKNRVYKPVYYLMGEESYYIDKISEYIADTVLTA
jgi:DNA polymerase-3 subunit delta